MSSSLPQTLLAFQKTPAESLKLWQSFLLTLDLFVESMLGHLIPEHVHFKYSSSTNLVERFTRVVVCSGHIFKEHPRDFNKQGMSNVVFGVELVLEITYSTQL